MDRMRREFGVEANVGRPQVSYRETVRGSAEHVEGRFVRQTGGSGQFGVVYIDVEPAPGEGFEFINKIKGGSVPSEYIPAVKKGIEEALENGVKAGYPMVDLRVTLVDGKYHDVDSSEVAFKVAGSIALKEAAKRAKPVLLEQIFAVEVVTHDAVRGLRGGSAQHCREDRRAAYRRARSGVRRGDGGRQRSAVQAHPAPSSSDHRS